MKHFQKTELIDFNKLIQSIDHYKSKHYKHIEVPWIVDKKTINQTTNSEFLPREITHDGRCLIGSAEQGFLQLYFDKLIDTNVDYVSMSPCFRLGDMDNTHREQFYKVELSAIVESESEAIIRYQQFLNDALSLFKSLNDRVKFVVSRQSETMIDIECKNLEMGSYGYRKLSDNEYLVFGTGIALPRFDMIKL